MGVRPFRHCAFSYNRYRAIITRCARVCVCVYLTPTRRHTAKTANKKRHRKDAISFGGGRGARCSSKNYVAIIPAMGWIYCRFIVVVVVIVLCMRVVTKVTEQRQRVVFWREREDGNNGPPERKKPPPTHNALLLWK